MDFHVLLSVISFWFLEWQRAASMRTPRSNFACTVVNDKVYVAGGRKWKCSSGLDVGEVYDPVTDKWEDLPPMPSPQMDCSGFLCKGKFYVLSDQGLPEQKICYMYNPLNGTWSTVDDFWPFSRAMKFSVQVVEDEFIYTVVDWSEICIKSRDNIQGEWQLLGSVPPVYLPERPCPLETFNYGFAALKKQLYIVGGRVLTWDGSGPFRLDIMKLGLVRVCDSSVRPLVWRETKPMRVPACGSIVGCAALEEKPSP